MKPLTWFHGKDKEARLPGRFLAEHRGGGLAKREHKEGKLFMQTEVYPESGRAVPPESQGGEMAMIRDDGTMAEVTDLYEAAYLVMKGLKIEGVECIPLSGTLACRMSFSGRGLEEALGEYFEKKACVNLYSFRSAYNQVNSYIHQAKKNYATRDRAANAGGEA